jgi:two-component sensor histidine kinase
MYNPSMKAARPRLQRDVGIGGFVTFLALLVGGFPMYLRLDGDRTLGTFVSEPLMIQLTVVCALFLASIFLSHRFARHLQVWLLLVYGMLTLSTADLDSLTGLLIVGVGVILAAQYGFFRTRPGLKLAVTTAAILGALLVQALRYWSDHSLSLSLLGFAYNAIAVLGLTSAYVIVLRDATSQVASRQTELELAVDTRTAELSTQVQARLEAEAAARESAAQAQALAQQRLQLLQEVHHRARNSLQMTLALLESMDPDSASASSMTETINRVRAIGLVYDLVDAEEDISSISLENYLENLCSYAQMGTEQSPLAIRFETSRATYCRLEPAVSLGLLLIELMALLRQIRHSTHGATIVITERASTEAVELNLRLVDSLTGRRREPLAVDQGSSGMVPALMERLHATLKSDDDSDSKWTLSIPRNVIVREDRIR